MHEQTTVSPVSTGEQYDAVRQLIALGEEKGDLLREEIEALLPADVASREVDDLLHRCRDAGIDVDAAALEREGPHHARPDADESDLTPGRPNTSSDVVRLYLADMSRVPLLTRQEEVTLAKRIEHGHRTVMVAISQTPSLVQQVIRLGDALRDDARLIRRLVTHPHEEVTATRLTTRTRDVLVQVDAVTAAWTEAQARQAAWHKGTHTTSAHRPTSPVGPVARARSCGPADPPHRV